MSRRELASKAAAEALRVRFRAGLALTDPVNPVDVAEKLGIQVWFRPLPSAEGLLIRAPHPVILLSSLRPSGRISFTCAHELGHFWFGHKGHVDTSDDGPVLREDSDDEYQANAFASYFLMPKTLIQHGFSRRGATPMSASPRTVLEIANWLGVGYSTLVHHLYLNLNLIDETRSRDLRQCRPGDIIGSLVGSSKRATLVDQYWSSRPVDIEVNELVVFAGPMKAFGSCVREAGMHKSNSLVLGVRPGTGHLEIGAGQSINIRVRRSSFEGRSIFRHLEELEGD